MSVPASAASDRNLLFGVLALQLDFSSRDQLVAAMTAWTTDKVRPLGQILVEQKALTPERHTLLEGLVQEHLRQHDDDPHKSLAAVSSVSSVREQLRQVADSDLHASLAYVPTAGDATDPFASRALSSIGTPTSSGLRFRILRPHAKGGLGQVSVALDEELKREVALKEIQGRHADHPESRARFLLEAEVTGGLEHPGIVPVYGLGQYEDGRPFYAMRFIRGDNLQAAIARFHEAEKPGRDPGERALALRGLLGRFVDVCNAIAYAHSRGILHRDLKPGNVMLGQYGETLVVDWGLAKPLGAAETTLATGERPLQPSSASGSATEMGRALGTPSYMSPEQAAGHLDRLGPASDVYSLGATLYALLTGKAPVEDPDVGVVLQRVQRGDFPRPRQAKADIAPALEAICLKAMALRPDDRYASVRALAEDVEHWLADEPVAAYREPLRARLGRWARRHRTGVTAAVAVLLVAVAGLSASTVLLNAANERERQAKELAQRRKHDAEVQRDKARQQFQLAREAVDRFHTRVSESPELKARGTEKLRTKLLETAAEFYERFVQDAGNDPEVQAERGRAYGRLAMLLQATGKFERAEKAYGQSLDILKALADAHPDAPRYREDLARMHQELADLLAQTGRNGAAEEAYRRALALQEKLADAHPADPAYQLALARCLNDVGILYGNLGRPGPSEEAYRRGQGIYQKLTEAHPDQVIYRGGLGNVCNNLGVLYQRLGRFGPAEGVYQEALKHYQALVDAHPEAPEYADHLATTLTNLGNVYRVTRRHEDAEKAYRRAADIFRKVADGHPLVPEYQSRLANCLARTAVLYRTTGRKDLAEKVNREAIALRRKLAAAHPQVPDYQSSLIDALLDLGEVCRRARRLQEALELHQEALATSRRLADANTGVPSYQANVGYSHHNLGLVYADMKRYDLAEKAYRDAIAVRKPLAAAHPEVPDYRLALAWSHSGLGDMCARQGKHEEARASHREAVRLCKELTAAHPDVPGYAAPFGGSYLGLAEAERQLKNAAAALPWYALAIERMEKAPRKKAEAGRFGKRLAAAHRGRALALGQLGRHAEALADWDRALALAAGGDVTALRLSRAVALARAGRRAEAVAEVDRVCTAEALAGVAAGDGFGAGPRLLRAFVSWAVPRAAVSQVGPR